jgi:hypothetical protein
VTLEVAVGSEEALHRLALRLAASASAPLRGLRLSWHDGPAAGGVGGSGPLSLDGSPGFALLARALRAGSEGGSACLGGLCTLSISKLVVGDGAARDLAAALHGHPSLASLELWNVSLEDEGALSIARLAAPDGNAALSELNLGRNLFSGEAREGIEATVDADRVRAKMY